MFQSIEATLVELAAQYVDIFNDHPRNPNNYKYVPERNYQRQMIIQELNYGLMYSKTGLTKENIFEYASHYIDNFGLLQLMDIWWPQLERFQDMYKERQRCLDEMKNNIAHNTTSFNSNWLNI